MGGFGTALIAIGDSNLPGITQQATNTAINLSQMQNQQRHQQVMEQQAAQENELRRQAGELQRLQAEEYRKQKELIPVDDTLAKIGFKSPEEIAYFKKKAGLNLENIGGTDYIQRGTGIKLFSEWAKDPLTNIEVGTLRINNTNKAIAQIDASLQSGSNLKPEQVSELQKQREALVNERTILANGMKAEHERWRAANKDSFEIGWDPEKKQYVSYNKYGGMPNGIVPLEIRKQEIANQSKENRLISVGEGGAVLDPETGSVVYKNPKTYKPGGGGGGGGNGGAKIAKQPTGADIKRLRDMIASATKGGKDPSPSDIALINEQAERFGYTFANNPTTETRGIPGVNWFDYKNTKNNWSLIPNNKGTAQQKQTFGASKGGGGKRQAAINQLRADGQPVTEANIKWMMDRI